MTSELSLTHNQWLRVCAVADLYGFNPWSEEWDMAMKIVHGREGKFPGVEWWNMGTFCASGFSTEETLAFHGALLSAHQTEFARLKREIALNPGAPRSEALNNLWRTNSISLISDVSGLAGQGRLGWMRERTKNSYWIFRLYVR